MSSSHVVPTALAIVLLAFGCGKAPPTAEEPARKSAASTTNGHSHGKPGESCFICDPAKRDKGRLWCQEHGRYEDRCWICHPELQDAKRPYCEEHGLYEDECTLCDPSRGARTDDREHEGKVAGPHGHPDGRTCFICDPAKRDKGRLWCKEHGRYEDRCWICHPELRDAKRSYCEEHGLYEDECTLCNPSRGARTRKAEKESKPALFCNEHRVPEHQCGICQPQLAPRLAVGGELLVRLPSARSVALAGLTFKRPLRTKATQTLPLLGTLRFDANHHARLTPLAEGVIAEISVDVGQQVVAGQPLATLHSPTVAAAKAEYLSARADARMLRAAHKRQSRLLKEQIASRRAVEEARAAYRRADVASRLARQRLRNLGLTEAEVAKVRDATSALVLRAPFGGTVVERSATRGQVADTRTELFAIADLGRLWVDLSVPEKEAARIPVGTPIEVRVQALPGEVIKGRVSWLSPAIDERTRMVRARGVVPNERGLLRHGMFAEVSAVLGNQPDAFRIPSAAIQRVDNLPFVFIQQEPSLFAARRVTVSPTRTTGEQLIRGGLRGGEPVVVDGSHALKSALLASRLGAGCTDD